MITQSYKRLIESRGGKYHDGKEIAEHISKVAYFLTDDTQTTKFGLFFGGTVGNGKTTLIKAIQQTYLQAYQGEPNKGLTAYSAKELNERCKDQDELNRLSRIEMLAIDDLGSEPAEVKNYGNNLTPLTDLIETRYNERLFTIISSNIPAKEIRKLYGDRVADRLNEMVIFLPFTQKSYRNAQI